MPSMDMPEMDENLFDYASSQDTLCDDWDYQVDDDDILGDIVEPDATPWLLSSSPMLTAGYVHDGPDAILLDRGIVPPSSQTTHARSGLVKDRAWVIASVEQMVERILDGLRDDSKPLSIVLKTRVGLTRRDALSRQSKTSLPEPKTIEITFPGTTAQEAWRFGQATLTRIIEIVHACLIDNVVISKRDLYYRHPDLFMKQSVVDRYVDDLACTLGISRFALNVTAAAKGLVAGNFRIQRADGSIFEGSGEEEGLLIPRTTDKDILDMANISHVVVVEKEATFRALLSSRSRSAASQGRLTITAKGYPDLASRKFLCRVVNHAPNIPVFVLVDFDPDGISIMSTYKHGSYRLAHEDGSEHDAPGLNVPRLRWIGVQSHQISQFPTYAGVTSESVATDDQGFMKMTERDRRKASSMLQWDLCDEDGKEPTWRRELQIMLLLNIKAEMQILEKREGGLASWLHREISSASGLRNTPSSDELDW